MYNSSFKYHPAVVTDNRHYPWQIPDDKFALRGKMLNEDSLSNMSQRKLETRQSQVSNFWNGSRIMRAKPSQGLAASSLYQREAMDGSVSMFDPYAVKNRYGVLSHMDKIDSWITQQGPVVKALLPWDGLQASDINSVVPYKYGAFRGPYSLKLYKSTLYNKLEKREVEANAAYRRNAQRQVWGDEPGQDQTNAIAFHRNVREGLGSLQRYGNLRDNKQRRGAAARLIARKLGPRARSQAVRNRMYEIHSQMNEWGGFGRAHNPKRNVMDVRTERKITGRMVYADFNHRIRPRSHEGMNDTAVGEVQDGPQPPAPPQPQGNEPMDA